MRIGAPLQWYCLQYEILGRQELLGHTSVLGPEVPIRMLEMITIAIEAETRPEHRGPANCDVCGIVTSLNVSGFGL